MFKFLIIFFLFLFNFTNSIASEVIYADEAKEMMDDHVKSSELLKVPLPKINRIIKDYQRYKDYRTNVMANNWHYTSYVWKDELDGKKLTKDFCTSVIIEFKVPTTPKIQEEVFKRCLDALRDYALIDFEGGIKLHEKIIFNIANADKDKWVYENSGKDNFNPRDYQLWGVLSPLVTFYAVNYDQFNYTEDQHKTIQNYFKNKAMIERLDRDGNRSRTKLCPIDNPMKLSGKKHKVNNCGTVRLRFASAELALATVSQDKELWAKGLWDLDYVLSMTNDKGFFVPLSAKGCKALGYTWDTSKLFSMNVELLRLASFDLLDYKTRHGKTISDAYEVLFKQYEDITISKHIAKKAIGAASCGRKPFKTHQKHIVYEHGGKKGYEEALEENWIRNKDDFINWSIRFVSEKHPEWLNGKFTPHEIKVYPWLSSYYHIQAFEIFNANIMSEGENLWIKKLSEKPKDYEKKYRFSDFKIFNKNASGRYELKSNNVKFASITNPIKPNKQNDHELYKAFIKGNLITEENKNIKFNEALVYQDSFEEMNHQILSIYIGESSNEDAILPLFRHSQSIKEKCNTLFNGFNFIEYGWMNFVSETSNLNFAKIQQCIHDYFAEIDDVESLELFETILAGTNSILDYLKNPEKQIAKLELNESILDSKEENFSIFNFENGTFKLKLNNVNFTSNSKPIKPKRQKEDQLYKSFINGNLTNTENKKIILDEALVYKRKFETDDQMLVIYIGNESGKGEDGIMPLFRHSENIQSKCGTRLLNQWGWMSFIIETKNEKFANNQQCIHDYFAEIDDVESYEVFEAVLSGSNSILSYLKTNVN